MQKTHREAIKTVMLGLGYQGSINADISCSLEGREIFVFFFKSRERFLLLFGWAVGPAGLFREICRRGR